MGQVSDREVAEGRQSQGENEAWVYSFDMTAWGSAPTSPTVTVIDRTAGNTDVTALVTSGSPSINGNKIVTPLIRKLKRGHSYLVKARAVFGANTGEAWMTLVCEEPEDM
jgi:hypothetical protein